MYKSVPSSLCCPAIKGASLWLEAVTVVAAMASKAADTITAIDPGLILDSCMICHPFQMSCF